MNRTFHDMTRAILKQQNTTKLFWAEMIVCAPYIRNTVTCVVTPENVKSFEMCTNKNPDVVNMRVFGSRCW